MSLIDVLFGVSDCTREAEWGVNPATGLPMSRTDALDVAGNMFGNDSLSHNQDLWTGLVDDGLNLFDDDISIDFF